MVVVDTSATVGSTVGVNLYWSNGKIITEADLQAAIAAGKGITSTATDGAQQQAAKASNDKLTGVEVGATKGATSGPGGTLGGEVDSNNRPIIDFSAPGVAGGHVNPKLLYMKYGDGYTGEHYKPGEPGANVTETRVALQASNLANHTQDNLADGTTYKRVGAGYIDASNRPYRIYDSALGSYRDGSYLGTGAARATSAIDSGNVVNAGSIDFSRAYTGKHLSNIPDDAFYAKQAIAGHTASIDNSDFSVGADANGNIPGWELFGAATAFDVVASSHFPGQNVAEVTLGSGASGAQSTRLIQVDAGQSVHVSVDAALFAGAAMKAVQIRYHAADGSVPSTADTTSTATGWSTLERLDTVPSGAAGFKVLVYSTSGTGLLDFTHVRVKIDDVRVAGSGYKTGDARNNSLSFTLGTGVQVSANPLTMHSDGSMDVNAHTATVGGLSKSYSAHAGAVTGLPTSYVNGLGNTIYYSYAFYTRDDLAGGSPAVSYLQLSGTTPTAAELDTIGAYDNSYYLGHGTVPSSGSSGGNPNPKLNY